MSPRGFAAAVSLPSATVEVGDVDIVDVLLVDNVLVDEVLAEELSVATLTATNLVEAAFQVATLVGLDGPTEKRPSPESQQFSTPLQQYDVSSWVTFAHETRSVPPSEAPSY